MNLSVGINGNNCCDCGLFERWRYLHCTLFKIYIANDGICCGKVMRAKSQILHLHHPVSIYF